MAASNDVLRAHVRRKQGTRSAFVSIEGSDSCFESHHRICMPSHGQCSGHVKESKSQRLTGQICLEQATGRLLVAVVTVSRQYFGANATTLISALRHYYVSGN